MFSKAITFLLLGSTLATSVVGIPGYSIVAFNSLARAQKIAKRNLPVLKVERVVHTIINEAPFIVDRTTTIVWT